jgi:MobA/VirD2-like, nuclease domain
MIPKGNQRAGGQQLATHLLNAYDNDSVEVADVRGATSQDLHGAFAEWYAEAKGTKCSKFLYSLSINPDHTQGPFNREHYYDFIRRAEDSLGLSGQPRAVVFHVKHGREHCHVVWSRIDTEKMKAVQLSHDRQKLRAVAQEYARDHNLTLPPGMQNNRGKDRFPDHAKTENLAEKQQEERTGTSKKQRMEQITKAWRESSNALSFVKALEAGGYFLARGDKRSYVVVDLYGEVHSLSRQLTGVKSKDLKARLADYPPDKLMDVAAVQDRARQQRQALLLKLTQQQRGREEPETGTQATPRQRRDALQQAQAIRRGNLEAKRQQLAERHSTERKALADLQSARSAAVVRDRAAKHPTGVLAFLARVTGFDALTAFRNVREDLRRNVAQRLQTAALVRRHRREMQNFKHQERALTSLDKRERRSLETGLRRDGLRQIARQDRSTIRPEFAAAAAGITQIRKGDDGRKEKLKKDFEAAARGREATETGGGESKGSKPAATKRDLQRAFEQARAARKPPSGQQEHTEEVDPEKLEQARKTKEELERRKPQPPGPERDRER